MDIAALLLASAFFIGIHLGIAGTSLRDRCVNLLGERVYQGLFFAASLVGISALCIAYGAVSESGGFWWQPPQWLRAVAPILGLIALFFGVLGLLTPSPTTVGMESTLKKPDAVQGILRITRHPFLCGVALWAAFHMLVAPTTPALILFGTLLIVALAGPASIDRKRLKTHGGDYRAFADKTSITPFLAVVLRRNSLQIKEIPWWQWLALIVVFVAVLVLHPILFGVSAAPPL